MYLTKSLINDASGKEAIFLCTRNIIIGNLVYFDIRHGYEEVAYTIKDADELKYAISVGAFRVIAPISKLAVWVKPNRFFEEDTVRGYDTVLHIDCPISAIATDAPDTIIQFICPTCNFPH